MTTKLEGLLDAITPRKKWWSTIPVEQMRIWTTWRLGHAAEMFEHAAHTLNYPDGEAFVNALGDLDGLDSIAFGILLELQESEEGIETGNSRIDEIIKEEQLPAIHAWRVACACSALEQLAALLKFKNVKRLLEAIYETVVHCRSTDGAW